MKKHIIEKLPSDEIEHVIKTPQSSIESLLGQIQTSLEPCPPLIVISDQRGFWLRGQSPSPKGHFMPGFGHYEAASRHNLRSFFQAKAIILNTAI
ncbi:hypothetical protein Ahy_A08g038301 isoform A [Arachis hypogaea]|uniref:Uncharacterized protein n=1 Tax=Arachis hypogaea TaxID=3818 RepID=A0A445BT44_ARAHY|nr:hypothetical protein Ahy_A08g038301 isoform A [Arachis hypogaea]